VIPGEEGTILESKIINEEIKEFDKKIEIF
jgi:hypothetical protein